MKTKKGFTLLEMLVVVGIIAVLVSIGISSYSTAQKKSRDAKRKSDLKAIQNALEQYYSICGYTYPAPSSGRVPTSITCTNPATTIMPTVPVDPRTGTRYTMSQTSSTDYTICAPNTPPLESESVPTYCLTNQQ
jgi:prepilin-type N-terminal cleavage/methylation domain-containing protein